MKFGRHFRGLPRLIQSTDSSLSLIREIGILNTIEPMLVREQVQANSLMDSVLLSFPGKALDMDPKRHYAWRPKFKKKVVVTTVSARTLRFQKQFGSSKVK